MDNQNNVNLEFEIFPKVVPVYYLDSLGERMYIGRITIDGVSEDGEIIINGATIENEFMRLLPKDGNIPIHTEIHGGLITHVRVQDFTPEETEPDTQDEKDMTDV